MDDYATRDKGLVLNLHVASDEGATTDHGTIADSAIVSDVACGHDVVVIADLCHRFRLSSAGDGVMLADGVAVTNSQIAALARKVLVQWIGSQHRARRDGIAVAHGGEALDVNV